MFKNNNHSFFAKLICLLIIIISIIITKNVYFLFLFLFIIGFISVLNNYIPVYILTIIDIFILSLLNNIPFFYYIYKFLIIVIYILYFTYRLDFYQKKYLYEKIFYRFNNTKWFIELIFYDKKYNENFEKVNTNNKLDKKEIERKTLCDMNDIYYLSRLKFYKYNNKKSYYVKFRLSKQDYIYIFVCFIIFLLMFIVRLI